MLWIKVMTGSQVPTTAPRWRASRSRVTRVCTGMRRACESAFQRLSQALRRSASALVYPVAARRGSGASDDADHARLRRPALLVLVERDVAIGLGPAAGPDRREREQRAIHHVRRRDVAHRGEDVLDAAGVLLVPLADHLLDLHALQVVLAAA